MAQPERNPAAPAEPPRDAQLSVLPLGVLARFHRLMNGEGWDVNLQRMCVDTDYAYRCLALAHTSSDERLRQAALGLFDAYDRNARSPALH